MVKRFLVFRDCDYNNSSGSAYLAGSLIFAFGAQLNVSGKNRIQPGNIGTADAYPSTDNFNNGSNIRRLMREYNSFGVDNITISLDGDWNYSAGSFLSTGSYILTPTKLLGMVTRKRTFYVMDGYLVPSLIDGDTGSEINSILTGSAHKAGSAYFSKNGIPIIIDTWNMGQNVNNIESNSWSITGFIDAGSYNWGE